MSAIKPGDVIRMSISPMISITQYWNLKPHASIERTVGDDPETDVKEMRSALKSLIHKAVLDELGLADKLSRIVSESENGLDDLVAHCKEQVTHVTSEKTQPSSEVTRRTGGSAATRKRT